MENPNIPAPLAENIALFFTTDGQSIMIIGMREDPVNSDTIFTIVFCWFDDVLRSRYILLTACPVVPELVIVFTISSSSVDFKSNSLNSLTGKNGISLESFTSLMSKPLASSILL